MQGRVDGPGVLALKSDELMAAVGELLAASVVPDADPESVRGTLSGMRPQIEELMRARGLEPTVPVLRVLVRGALKQLGCGGRAIGAGVEGVSQG